MREVREDSPNASGIDRRLNWWSDPLIILLLTRAMFVLVAYLGSGFLSELRGAPLNSRTESFPTMWNQWDAAHYVEIALVGYGPSWWNTAYFPLLPLLIRPFAAAGLDPTVAGMFVVAVGSLVALIYLYRLAEEEIGEGAGWRACTYLAFFPTAVFLVAPYGEPLFLAGAIPAFYYARRARWGAVALPAAVALGSRPTGLALLVGLSLEGLRQTLPLRQRLQHLGALVLGAIPLAAYAIFLWRRMGHPFHFVFALRAWHRRATDPVTTFQATWQDMRTATDSAAWAYAWRGEILAVLIAAFVVMIFLWRREWGYAGFMGATLASYAASGYYFGTPRMLLTFFPALLLLAGLTRDERWHSTVLLIMVPVAAAGTIVYTQGLWFF